MKALIGRQRLGAQFQLLVSALTPIHHLSRCHCCASMDVLGMPACNIQVSRPPYLLRITCLQEVKGSWLKPRRAACMKIRLTSRRKAYGHEHDQQRQSRGTTKLLDESCGCKSDDFADDCFGSPRMIAIFICVVGRAASPSRLAPPPAPKPPLEDGSSPCPRPTISCHAS